MFKIYSNIKLNENPSSGRRIFPCGESDVQADNQTYRQTVRRTGRQSDVQADSQKYRQTVRRTGRQSDIDKASSHFRNFAKASKNGAFLSPSVGKQVEEKKCFGQKL